MANIWKKESGKVGAVAGWGSDGSTFENCMKLDQVKSVPLRQG